MTESCFQKSSSTAVTMLIMAVLRRMKANRAETPERIMAVMATHLLVGFLPLEIVNPPCTKKNNEVHIPVLKGIDPPRIPKISKIKMRLAAITTRMPSTVTAVVEWMYFLSSLIVGCM